MNSFRTFRILLTLISIIAVQAQDRSRSRYIPPPDEDDLSDEDFNPPPRTSRRISAPVQRSRPSKENSEPDSNVAKDAWRAPAEDHRLSNIDERVRTSRTESHRQPITSPPYSSDLRSRNEGPIREELPEAPATPPPSRQQEKKKRPKKRRRPKPDLLSDKPENIPIGAVDRPPESVILENDRGYNNFRNLNPPPQVENVSSRESSLPHNSPPLGSRTLPSSNTRSRASLLENTRSRIPETENTRSRSAPQESVRSRGPPLENTRSHSSLIESTRSRHSPLENTRSRSSAAENTRSRGSAAENTRSRSPSLENTNSRTQNLDPARGNSESRSSRRHSFQPQPAHNRLPIQDEDTISNLGTQDDRNKDSQIAPETDFSSDHVNSNPQTGHYNRNYDSLNSPVETLPYQQPNEDRLPSPERLPEHVSAIHLSSPGQPFDGPPFSQPGVDYSNLPQEPESKLPLNLPSHSDDEQNMKFPIPTNRLTNPTDVIYKLPETSEHSKFLHSNNDQQSELKNRQISPDSAVRTVSDRLPTTPQRHSQQQQSAPEQQRGQVRTNPRYSASAQSRVGSTYQSETQENSGSHRNVNSNRSGPDPKLQNVASRYLQSHRDLNDRTVIEENSPPLRARSEVPLQRAGSRYQTESLDIDDYSSSRIPQSRSESSIPETTPPRQRTVPRSQRTRSRYQPEPVTDSAPEEISRRVPEQGSQRTRSRYQPDNDVQAQSSPQRDNLRSQGNQPDTPRSVPRRDRTSSRYQGSSQRQPSPVSNVSPDPHPPQVHHRSRPQFEGDSQGPSYSEEAQPEYPSDYQSVQRVPPQRHPAPQPVPIQQPQAIPRRRQTNRQPQQAPPSRSSSNEPTSRSNKSNFRCPDPNGFYPDEEQCDKYYECRNEIAEEGLCPDGQVFNLISSPTYLRCDSARNVDCSSRPKLQEPQSTKNCPRRFGLFPHKNDCTKFWQCVDGAGTEVKCPPGLVYDDSKGTCNWADLVHDTCASEDLLGFTCPEATPDQLLDGVYARYAHPENCQLHYTCIKGVDGERRPRMLSCNEGSVFDPETAQCTRPENVPGCEEFYGKPVARTPAKQQPREPPPEEEELPSPRTNSRRRRPSQRNRS